LQKNENTKSTVAEEGKCNEEIEAKIYKEKSTRRRQKARQGRGN
jgi:hypothetical protein